MACSRRTSTSYCGKTTFVTCILFIFFTAQITRAQWSYDDEGCRTPNRGIGNCLPVDQCKPILKVIETYPQPIPTHIQKLLRSYQCGVQRGRPKVCCPDKDLQIGTPIPEAPDVTNHRNIKLLPKNCGFVDTGDRIVNGNQTGLFEFPWMALLAYNDNSPNGRFKCGASIINEHYLLTAAHCIKDSSYKLIGARIGEHNINTEIDCEANPLGGEDICAPKYQDLEVEEFVVHPSYSRAALQNDIALVRVKGLKFEDNVRTICLPLEDARNVDLARIKDNMIVTGWGYTEKGVKSPDLLKAELPYTSLEKCNQLYQSFKVKFEITHKQICAGGKDHVDSCNGDSGGPLQLVGRVFGDTRFIQHGVVSFGHRFCGEFPVPGVYTRIAYYMDWILDTMRP